MTGGLGQPCGTNAFPLYRQNFRGWTIATMLFLLKGGRLLLYLRVNSSDHPPGLATVYRGCTLIKWPLILASPSGLSIPCPDPSS